MKRSQGRSTRQELTGAEVMEGCCFLPCSPWLPQPASYIAQNHLPRGGTARSGLGPPMSIIHQEVFPQATLMEAILQLRVPPRTVYCVSSWQNTITVILLRIHGSRTLGFKPPKPACDVERLDTTPPHRPSMTLTIHVICRKLINAFIKIVLLLVFVWVWPWMCVDTHGGQKKKVSGALQLELQAVMGILTWVLGTEHRFSRRSASTLKHWSHLSGPDKLLLNEWIKASNI